MTPRPASILVADDSESNRYVLATWLRRAGYDVVEASSGEQALTIVASQPLDLTVLDVNLPDISGYEVCERIKATPSTATLPVLHVSATAVQSSDRSEGLRRGADGYLVEPVEREELVASIEALLRGAAAQRTALRLAQRLRRLNEATLAINESSSLPQLVATITSQASALFDAMAVALIAIEGADALMCFAPPDAEARLLDGATAALATVQDAVRDGRTVAPAQLGPNLPARADATFVVTPLRGGGEQHGYLLTETPEADERAGSDEFEVVLVQYARAAANAIKNTRSFDVERRIALTLQRSLLPVLPSVPGLDAAVRYEASGEHSEVGGDFYELFPLDDHRVAFAIGDVVGHSLEAATIMAELRTGIRSYVLEGHGPARTLERLNGLLGRFHPDVTATVCCGTLDLRTGVCELANAGHPPALVARGGDVTYLPFGGPLLGVDAAGTAPHVFTLDRGDVLVLYTDGLIERRREDINAGFERLAAAARRPGRDLNELCDRLLRDAGPADRADDIALVALRITSAAEGRL